AEHRLNIREGYSPVRQKKRGQAPKRNKAIQEEVEKLVDAEIMKEVHYHSWLSNLVLVEELKEKSINEKEILDVVEEEGNTWMTPIGEYLTKEILPEDRKKARAVRRKAASMHSGPRSVVAKVIQTGYYWPTMHMDARNLIRECNDCQIHRPVPRNPQQNLTPITSPWPFYKWGIDIAGPFPEGPVNEVPYGDKTLSGRFWPTMGDIISDNGKAVPDNHSKIG
ncbi:reverse transcriptase domain-containing protein, partial [Tanacetum coccineum]